MSPRLAWEEHDALIDREAQPPLHPGAGGIMPHPPTVAEPPHQVRRGMLHGHVDQAQRRRFGFALEEVAEEGARGEHQHDAQQDPAGSQPQRQRDAGDRRRFDVRLVAVEVGRLAEHAEQH